MPIATASTGAPAPRTGNVRAAAAPFNASHKRPADSPPDDTGRSTRHAGPVAFGSRWLEPEASQDAGEPPLPEFNELMPFEDPVAFEFEFDFDIDAAVQRGVSPTLQPGTAPPVEGVAVSRADEAVRASLRNTGLEPVPNDGGPHLSQIVALWQAVGHGRHDLASQAAEVNATMARRRDALGEAARLGLGFPVRPEIFEPLLRHVIGQGQRLRRIIIMNVEPGGAVRVVDPLRPVDAPPFDPSLVRDDTSLFVNWTTHSQALVNRSGRPLGALLGALMGAPSVPPRQPPQASGMTDLVRVRRGMIPYDERSGALVTGFRSQRGANARTATLARALDHYTLWRERQIDAASLPTVAGFVDRLASVPPGIYPLANDPVVKRFESSDVISSARINLVAGLHRLRAWDAASRTGAGPSGTRG